MGSISPPQPRMAGTIVWTFASVRITSVSSLRKSLYGKVEHGLRIAIEQLHRARPYLAPTRNVADNADDIVAAAVELENSADGPSWPRACGRDSR